MLSLKDDQHNAMNNINAMLSNADKESNLIYNIKTYIGELANIHDRMRETESFIVQLTAKELSNSIPKPEKPANIGSDGAFNEKENKEESTK